MLPFATSACGRAVWVSFLVVGLGLASHMLLWGYCRDVGYVVFAYEVLSVVVGVLSLLVECQIAKASTFGTIIGERAGYMCTGGGGGDDGTVAVCPHYCGVLIFPLWMVFFR